MNRKGIFSFALHWSVGAAALLTVMSSAPARAEYPDRLINAIVPFGPGGPSDVVARIVAAGMANVLGQQIIILNRPGAGGNIGMGQAAHAKPDGYTLLFCSVATTQNPATYRNLPYDPVKDLVAVAIVGESPTMIGVSATKVPATNLRDFIDLAKKSPGKYNIAGAGGQLMTIEKFLLHFGLDMQIINYGSGGEAATALMGGQVDIQLNNATTLTAGAQMGKIRLLAVAGKERLKSFPDLPTTGEAGFPEYTDKAYVGLYVAAGTPPDIIARLHDAANAAMQSRETDEKLRALDYFAAPSSQADAQAFYLNEIQRWKEVAKTANIQPFD